MSTTLPALTSQSQGNRKSDTHLKGSLRTARTTSTLLVSNQCFPFSLLHVKQFSTSYLKHRLSHPHGTRYSRPDRSETCGSPVDELFSTGDKRQCDWIFTTCSRRSHGGPYHLGASQKGSQIWYGSEALRMKQELIQFQASSISPRSHSCASQRRYTPTSSASTLLPSRTRPLRLLPG